MWKQWSQNNPEDPAGAEILQQTATAETLYLSKRVAEAENVINDIFSNLMTNT